MAFATAANASESALASGVGVTGGEIPGALAAASVGSAPATDAACDGAAPDREQAAADAIATAITPAAVTPCNLVFNVQLLTLGALPDGVADDDLPPREIFRG
jgi:hypothetical protein